MVRSRKAMVGVLSCATACVMGGCSVTQTVEAPVPATARSVGLVRGDAIGRHSFSEDRRIAWAPDLPWTASYRSVMQQYRRTSGTATVHVDPDR
jgi:hypothetical protein